MYVPADSPEWQLIQCVHDLFVVANELDFKPSLWRYFATPTYKKAMKLFEHHENLTKHFLKKGKEQLKNNSGGENGVLAKLLAINEEVAHIMASDMLFAGVDTDVTNYSTMGGLKRLKNFDIPKKSDVRNVKDLPTRAANTVTATLYLLATNPEKQDKLREELRSGSDRRYLRACVKESLRIMPVVSGNLRKTTKEYNVMGYKIPKDVSRRIAELEMDIFVARLIENFQVEWFGPPPRIQQESLNYIKGPFNFIFNDVKK
ncbi:hypothetical protein HF086_011146 [Spodoptera exigua]|uniref:Cytochrome p450 n=1 Tax=Spodoptera exigua TaxID=7107 RepID=A0A922S8I6_SPOEX|nr:hypothetical protein HF086_011146 [Spodoptera exigua]